MNPKPSNDIELTYVIYNLLLNFVENEAAQLQASEARRLKFIELQKKLNEATNDEQYSPHFVRLSYHFVKAADEIDKPIDSEIVPPWKADDTKNLFIDFFKNKNFIPFSHPYG